MTYSSSFSTKNALNFSTSCSNKRTKSITSLATSVFSLHPQSPPSARSEFSNLGLLLAGLGQISFSCFFKSLYDKNLSLQSGNVSSISPLRLFQNFMLQHSPDQTSRHIKNHPSRRICRRFDELRASSVTNKKIKQRENYCWEVRIGGWI